MQISESVHALRIPFQLTIRPGISVARFVYVYLILGKREVWLVDAGVAGSENAIFGYLETLGRKPEEITRVVQTHSHPDHIGATPAIQKATGCKIAAHAAERDWIEDVELQCRLRPVPGFHTLVGGSVRVDRVLADGDLLAMSDGLALEILHTPGHSPGSLSVWLPSEKVLLCGDAVPLPGSLPIYEDARQSIRSVERLRKIEGVDVLLASWDEPRRSPEVPAILAASCDYLRRIDAAVAGLTDPGTAPEPMDLCKRMVAALGLPEAAVTPLVARSFMAHWKSRPVIRPCGDADFEVLVAIINDAAEAYRGVIPDDRWHDPYMSREELRHEIAAGVRFWGYEESGELLGVMGIQDVQDVTLIRHAYVRTARRGQGIGGELLSALRPLATRPILIGTWAAATWAIRFYERHGFRLVSTEEKNRLLKKYWSIPDRQVDTSVVLAETSRREN